MENVKEKFDILKISECLGFSVEDTIDLVNDMLSLEDLNRKIKNTDDIIACWQDSCFRADNIDEIIEQFDRDEYVDMINDIDYLKKIGGRIFYLKDSKLLVVLGLWFGRFDRNNEKR